MGRRLDDLKLREHYGANIIGVERWRKFRRVIVNVNGVTELRVRDVLLIDMSASEVSVRQFCTEQMLEPMILRGEYFSDQALDGYVFGVIALEGVHRGDDVVVFADGERCGNAELTHGVAFRVRARRYWQQCRDSNAVLSVVGCFITLWRRM